MPTFRLYHTATASAAANAGSVTLRGLLRGAESADCVLLSSFAYTSLRWILNACPALKAVPRVFLVVEKLEAVGIEREYEKM